MIQCIRLSHQVYFPLRLCVCVKFQVGCEQSWTKLERKKDVYAIESSPNEAKHKRHTGQRCYFHSPQQRFIDEKSEMNRQAAPSMPPPSLVCGLVKYNFQSQFLPFMVMTLRNSLVRLLLKSCSLFIEEISRRLLSLRSSMIS
jgi:hypothetical protein